MHIDRFLYNFSYYFSILLIYFSYYFSYSISTILILLILSILFVLLLAHPPAGGLWFFWLFEVCVFSPSGGVLVRLVGALSFCYWFSFYRCVPSGAGILGLYFGTFREQLGKRSRQGTHCEPPP